MDRKKPGPTRRVIVKLEGRSVKRDCVKRQEKMGITDGGEDPEGMRPCT